MTKPLEQYYKFSVINTSTQEKVTLSLRDESNNLVDMLELAEDAANEINTQLADPAESFIGEEVMSLAAQCILTTLESLTDKDTSHIILASSALRDAVMRAFMHGFVMADMMHELKISTEITREKLSPEEVFEKGRYNTLMDAASAMLLTGMTAREVAAALVSELEATTAELNALGLAQDLSDIFTTQKDQEPS